MSPRNYYIEHDKEFDVLYVIDKRYKSGECSKFMVNADTTFIVHFGRHIVVGFIFENYSKFKLLDGIRDKTEFEQMEEFDRLIDLINAGNKIFTK